MRDIYYMSFNKKAAVFYYRHRKIILICINLVSVILLVVGLAVTKRVSRGGEYRTKEDLAIYIHKYHELPKNFITLNSRDNAARCNESTKRCIIGGDSFWNDGQFREYGIRSDQCFQIVDIPDEDYTVYNRGTKRMVYTINTYKVRLFYSEDNCLTFEEIRLSDIQKARNIWLSIFLGYFFTTCGFYGYAFGWNKQYADEELRKYKEKMIREGRI